MVNSVAVNSVAVKPEIGQEEDEDMLDQINQRDWQKPKRGIKGQEWENRQHFTNNEAIMGRCAIKRLKMGEEHCWTSFSEESEDFEWRKKKKKGVRQKAMRT